MNVESGLREVPQKAADEARTRIVSLLRKAQPPPSNITREEGQAIRTLKNDPELIILPADKGNATVILDRDEYGKKIESMLDGQITYEKIKKDPAPALERRMNAKLLALNKKDPSRTSYMCAGLCRNILFIHRYSAWRRYAQTQPAGSGIESVQLSQYFQPASNRDRVSQFRTSKMCS